MKTIEELDQKLAKPSQKLVEDVSTLDGDILILGAGGKMGPSLAALAKNAVDESGKKRDVICVSRFSNPEHQQDLEKQGIKTIAADLMIEDDLQSLPEIKNVLYMVGFKFGSAENQSMSWAINSYLPGRVADKFKESSIVAFSTGNVYPLVDVKSGGATEAGGVGPVGEYAQSCLGRERVFEYFSRKNGTPVLNYRLNYAIDMRYGVLLEIAQNVFNGNPVNLRTGHANVIWQGDANEIAIRCLKHCSTPPTTLNVTGPETISIRWLAKEFAKRMKKEAEFVHEEEDTALLSNATRCHQIFGYPSVSLLQMIDWTVEWVENEGKTIDKPTKFQERKGDF